MDGVLNVVFEQFGPAGSGGEVVVVEVAAGERDHTDVAAVHGEELRESACRCVSGRVGVERQHETAR